MVIGVPLDAPPARVGERFTLRESGPLRVGPGREARLKLGPIGAGDLLLGVQNGVAFLRATAPTLRASVSGREVFGSAELPLASGDVLYVHPGLVLELREGAPVAFERDRALELEVARRDDAATWQVFEDALEEKGDPLGAWLRDGTAADDLAHRRQLKGLAESVRGGLITVGWNARHLLEVVTFTRQAVTGAPGLMWQLRQLSGVAVARLLPRVALALFAGPAPAGADELAAEVIDALAQLDGVSALRSVSLGFVSQPRDWRGARAAWERLRERAPLLPEWKGVLVSGGRAQLSLIARPVDVESVSADVVLNPARSDVGTAPGCLVRIVGNAPAVSCTLMRTVDGEWVVFDEHADPFHLWQGRRALRVNGSVTARATLGPGDVVEPVEGLQFRFTLS